MQKIEIKIILIGLIFTGCSVTRENRQTGSLYQSEPSSVILSEAVGNNLTNRDFFISKGKINTSGDAGRISLYFSMKHKVPGIYLISIRSKSGTEAIRLYIDRDTVLVNNRLNKTVLIGNTYDFERITGIPSELLKISIGDFFANKPVIKDNEKCVNNETKIDDYYLGLIIKSTLNCLIGKAKSFRITTGVNEEYISIEYKNHRDDINKVPRSVEIYDFRKKIKIVIAINKYSAPWFGDIEFIPGSGYKIKPLI